MKLLTLGDVLNFLRRRQRTILIWALACLFLGVFYCAVATRRYQSESLIEVKRSEDSLGLSSLVRGAQQVSGDISPLEENVTLATKVEELESQTLELRVIEQLHLEDTKDFKPHFTLNPMPMILNLFTSPAKKDAPGTPFMESPSRRARALTNFKNHLKVGVVPGTRVISISFANPDPALAASVVNALTNDLIEYSFETRSNATKQLSGWIGDQIDSVRQQAEEMQRRESKLLRETNTFNLNGTNAAGQAMVYSPLLDRLQQSTLALEQAESNRILRGAVDQIVQSGDPSLVSGLAGSNLASNGNPQSAESLDVIKTLLAKEAEQRLAVSQDEQRYGSANPKLIQDKAQLQAVRSALQAENTRLVERAKNDYAIAVKQEQMTRATHDALMKQADVSSNKALEYEIVRQEAQDARQLYTDLDHSLHEADVIAGLRSADMTVLTAGFPSDRPSSPKVPLLLPASLLLGIILGVIAAGVVEFGDDTIASPSAVESELGLNIYGVLPDFASMRTSKAVEDSSATSSILVVAKPDSAYAESLRALRTSILLSRPADASKVILVTGSVPGEGKSTTVANLGAIFERGGARTLLVEANLRHPMLAQRVGLPTGKEGLSQMLTGQLPKDWALAVAGTPNLYCVPAGQHAPNPYELLSSPSMSALLAFWKDRFDVVLIDGPAVLPVVDSVHLSDEADLVLLLARFGVTSVPSLRAASSLLSRTASGKLGVVLNGLKCGSQAHYEYYGYRNHDYTRNQVEEAQ